MRVSRIPPVCAFFVILGLGSSAQAAPLNLKCVSAGAKWLVHLDADAARAATISQRVNEKVIEGRAEISSFVAKIHELTGMDFRTDLYDVTAYSKQVGGGKIVVLVHAKFDEVDLLVRAAKARDYKVTKYGYYDIHTWLLNDPRNTRPAALAICRSETLILATSVEDVQAALDVLDGKTANARAGSPLSGDVRRGTILSVRSAGFGDAKLPATLQILKDVQSISLSLGELEKRIFIDAKGLMTSKEAADSAAAMLDGAKVLGRLRFADDEKSLDVLDAVQIGGEEKTVTIHLDAKADDIWQVIQTRFKGLPEPTPQNRREEK